MSEGPSKVWVDVTAFSRSRCLFPIRGSLKYATAENFVGRPVLGYHPAAQDVCLMTQKAALALCLAQNYFVELGLGLIVFDAYRPLRAVKDFCSWMKEEPTGSLELERKQIHYPHLEKRDLAKLGYLASDVSRHCFGNTVDVGLISLSDEVEVEMGTVFDYFGKASNVKAPSSEVGEQAVKNRSILISGMQKFEFSVYDEEYWHFEHQAREIDEPMDFEITPALKGLNS